MQGNHKKLSIFCLNVSPQILFRQTKKPKWNCWVQRYTTWMETAGRQVFCVGRSKRIVPTRLWATKPSFSKPCWAITMAKLSGRCRNSRLSGLQQPSWLPTMPWNIAFWLKIVAMMTVLSEQCNGLLTPKEKENIATTTMPKHTLIRLCKAIFTTLCLTNVSIWEP